MLCNTAPFMHANLWRQTRYIAISVRTIDRYKFHNDDLAKYNVYLNKYKN